jgi:hypothetical protein
MQRQRRGHRAAGEQRRRDAAAVVLAAPKLALGAHARCAALHRLRIADDGRPLFHRAEAGCSHHRGVMPPCINPALRCAAAARSWPGFGSAAASCRHAALFAQLQASTSLPSHGLIPTAALDAACAASRTSCMRGCSGSKARSLQLADERRRGRHPPAAVSCSQMVSALPSASSGLTLEHAPPGPRVMRRCASAQPQQRLAAPLTCSDRCASPLREV